MASIFTLDRICRSTPVLGIDDHANWPAWRSNLELYLMAHNLWRVVADPGIGPCEPIKQDYFRQSKIITAGGAALYGISASLSVMKTLDEDRYLADCKVFDEWIARDAQARLIILASVSVGLASELSRELSAANMWHSVNERFAASGGPVGAGPARSGPVGDGPVGDGPVGAVGGGPVDGSSGSGGNGGGGDNRDHRRNGGDNRGSIGDGGRSRDNGGSGGNGDGGASAIGGSGGNRRTIEDERNGRNGELSENANGSNGKRRRA